MKGVADSRSSEILQLIERGLGSGDFLGERFYARTHFFVGFLSAAPEGGAFFQVNDPPMEFYVPHLAESYEMPDPLTIIVNLRQGIHWHNKPPMNGRELVADDVVFNYHRVTGLGSGFTEKSVAGGSVALLPIESIVATDTYTVVFNMNALHHFALRLIYGGKPDTGWIYPPEVVKEHGDAKDWRNMVGTGPYMLTDWVEGSSITYTSRRSIHGRRLSRA